MTGPARVTPATEPPDVLDLTAERADAFDALLERLARAERHIEALERSNVELSRMAVDVAHDLRAPMQVLAGYAALLTSTPSVEADEVAQDYVAVMLSTIETMRAMLDGALDHARATGGDHRMETVDCAELATSVLAMLRHKLVSAGAEVELGDLPMIRADRLQLARVFQNLVVNALAHAAGPRILRIRISARATPGGWEFRVADNGVGVPSQDREAIFAPYQRGSNTPGAGLGLAICKRIIQRHGGRIWVESDAGQGAAFCFVLPNGGDPRRPADVAAADPVRTSGSPQSAHSRS